MHVREILQRRADHTPVQQSLAVWWVLFRLPRAPQCERARSRLGARGENAVHARVSAHGWLLHLQS